MKQQWNIAVGIYQDIHTAQTVLNRLRRQGIYRSALISHEHNGQLHIQKNRNLFAVSISSDLLQKFQRWVIRDEIFVVVQLPSDNVKKVLNVLRHVESRHPATFLLRAELTSLNEGKDLPREPLTMDLLKSRAILAAKSLQSVSPKPSKKRSLLNRLRASSQMLALIKHNVAEAEYVEQTVTLSADWLLDNMHVIQGNIEEIQRNLPKKFYRELPTLTHGTFSFLPRIYAIAQIVISSTAGKLSRENIVAFLQNYQTIQKLTMGELWAIPLLLRFCLVETIEHLALQVERRLREGEWASFWGNRLLNVSKRDPEKLPQFLHDLAGEMPQPSPHFSEELLDHLFHEEMLLPYVKRWLEECLCEKSEEIVTREQMAKAAEQVTLSNAIISLITLSQLSWREIFESVSPVDSIFNEDPSETYPKMDFNTRDTYRHSVEVISKRSFTSESDIATAILEYAKQGKSNVEKHVGYYLIDKGRSIIEKAVNYRPSWRQRFRRFLMQHSTFIYLAGIAFIMLIGWLMIFALAWYWNEEHVWLFSLLALLPLSEIAVQALNFKLTVFLPPDTLPKMSFKEGIPEEHRTLVIIPMMLSSESVIKENIARLEVHYLANEDREAISNKKENDSKNEVQRDLVGASEKKAFRFGLFADFKDASQQHTEEDSALIECALNGIKYLRSKYGEEYFFLFHRKRVWSNSEASWIGWERKRGKLEMLNAYLMGENLQENILKEGNAEALKGIRYVITLDADAHMPKDKARHLVETLAHPLNQPYLSQEKKVLRGYTLLQPRVSTHFPSSKSSLFARIFANISGIDPYAQVVSDVYQDLTHEGSYHGKGIYDVKAFHTILSDRYPDEHLLSHDLIEGAYVRVGFASDIVLFDLFPENYMTWSQRQHRWIRGDWQIADWIFPCIPDKTKKKIRNPLSLLNRWKILDNMRRSLFPVLTLTLLLGSWLFSSFPLLWTTLALFSFLLPPLLQSIHKLLSHPLVLIVTWSETAYAFFRALLSIVLLPHQAYISLDAICRVFYRRLVSRRHLLEWSTEKHASLQQYQQFLIKLTAVSLYAIAVLTYLIAWQSSALFVAIPLCVLWILSPWVVYLLDKPFSEKKLRVLSRHELLFLRNTARKTWRYFDDFVGTESNWLPPDNYQAALGIEVAQRTSPTNIGLWMLAALTAYDFRYITADIVIDRVSETMSTLKKLEHYEGHLLNWYQTQTMHPLYPRYVSTVDSGNFLASLWTFEKGVEDMLDAPILDTAIFEGIADTVRCLQSEDNKAIPNKEYNILTALIKEVPQSLLGIISVHKKLLDIVQTCLSLSIKEKQSNESVYWLNQLEKQLVAWETVISRYFSWVKLLPPQAATLFPLPTLSLKQLASRSFMHLLTPFLEIQGFKEHLDVAQWLSQEKISQMERLLNDVQECAENMNMRFLYNQERKFFSIGYHVDECKLDSSYYDLLASEARISSLVSIAKDDVPMEHWWALGRPFSFLYGRQVLRSWGGTMFEYLMPLLFTKSYPNSLLTEGCAAAVSCQIDYGNKRGIPWGISEAAFSEIDRRRTYQYRSFGVPGLGFKRDLEEDLVVSPYSSALALMIDLPTAVKNLRRLKEGRLNLFSDYGFYESIDFTRQHGPHGERGVIIYAYMAHHQGMTLLSINNIFHDHCLNRRFHANPRIQGVEPLLYEKMPLFPSKTREHVRKEIPISRLVAFKKTPIMGVMDTPHTLVPKINLLSNGNYALMVTNSGGGYSRWKDFDITRWRADTTCDSWGSFCYIKNLVNGHVWSSGYNPTESQGGHYSVNFKADKVEIRRRDYQIETLTEIVVSPEDNAEIRLMTIANLSKEVCQLEITSYMELAMAPHKADRAHSAFNKMFIETNITEADALTAHRRLRSPDDPQIWVGHKVVIDGVEKKSVEYETDRMAFIGRGRTLRNPVALDRQLSNTHGTVLDPIFSLRCHLTLQPGQRLRLSFITMAAETQHELIDLIRKYNDFASSQRALEMAWTYAELDLRHLRIHQEEVQLFQKLASRILYPHGQMRPSTDRLRKNRLGQQRLWSYSISGDFPIVVVTVADVHEVDLVKQVLIAYNFWRLRGLKVDLVILNEEATGYEHPLGEQLQRLINAHTHHIDEKQQGAVFLLNSDQLPEEDITLLLSVSRVNLIAARGSLRQQLVSPMQVVKHPPALVAHPEAHEVPSESLPFLELVHFNGLGGFTKDGKEYVIYLGPHAVTPLPWVNVIANPHFGTIVSESGVGMTWYGNSQSNRLTPWSNDPVTNPISDIIYIRDEQLGTYWTPTPSPIRELDAYRIRHGQGYTLFEHISHGISQELLVFVPVNDADGLPLRIQRLRLINKSSFKRELSIIGYSEWVLGNDREDSQVHVITEWDLETQSLFAYNCYNPDYGNHVAFATTMPSPASYGADRTEFLGRNSTTASPAALKRKGLSGLTGAALDPCAALQLHIYLEPAEERELVFVMGYAKSIEEARAYIFACKEKGYIDKLFMETQEWWDKFLSTIQINIPDNAVNFSCNRWLLYQSLSCRFWGRSAFYQSSGAYGFRDQLQDVMALVYAAPNLARAHILLAASRQFEEGDVQHWWHPPSNSGVRTRISDDLLWLPYVVCHYIRITQDMTILDENIPFLKGPLLKDDEHEAYFNPEISSESRSLLEHCRRAIHKGITIGSHGLPLIGGGDWNDGMNRVGIQGRGESVWLAWFVIQVLKDFGDLLKNLNEQPEVMESFQTQVKRLTEAIEANAWDGAWYRRAYFDDGTPLGSSVNSEGMIDSISQSWAVICGEGNVVHAEQALLSAEQHLVKLEDHMLLLLSPPFDKTLEDPGYIKGYPPGVRENGGQYTHGSLWLPMAFARRGEGDKAVELLLIMHPTYHAVTPEQVARYKVEPYAVVADVYALPGQVGRGGWSWYTGAAGWMYRIWLEEILGFKLRGKMLTLTPTLPKTWPGYKLRYRYGKTLYDITVEKDSQNSLEIDGVISSDLHITLVDDGKVHHCRFS